MAEKKLVIAEKKPLLTILPIKGWSLPDFRELLEYKELLYFLVWRELKVRYKQTAIGIGWAIIPPVFNMLIFTFIFGGLAKFPSEGIPYAIFSFTGLAAWSGFAKALTGASNSLLTGSGLSAKVYFPRLLIAISAILSSLVDFAISLVLLFILLIAFHIFPSWPALTLILFIFVGLLTAFAAGLWLSVLTVQIRDIREAVTLLISIWMFVSPVAYSPTLLSNGIWSTIYWLNPMAVVVQGFRWALLGSFLPPLLPTLASMMILFVVLVFGLLYFHRVERIFIDLV